MASNRHRPVVIAGDGTLGHVRRAPYDRITATRRAQAYPARPA
ncbi:hypothetical protein ACFCWG_32415 [Streptomyces sp. NPDC056390]